MSVTIEELENKAKELADLKGRKDIIKLDLKVIDDALEKLENEYLALLQEAEIASYKSKHGTITICNRFSVKFPKELDQRESFAKWAKEQGIYEELFTVNSQTLNSLYKKEKELAEEKGELFFRLPGIDDPTIMTYLSVRK